MSSLQTTIILTQCYAVYIYRTLGDDLVENPWGKLAGAFAEVARHDPRPAVADAAALALIETLKLHGDGWDVAAWDAVYLRGLAYMLDLPETITADSSNGAILISY